MIVTLRLNQLHFNVIQSRNHLLIELDDNLLFTMVLVSYLDFLSFKENKKTRKRFTWILDGHKPINAEKRSRPEDEMSK